MLSKKRKFSRYNKINCSCFTLLVQWVETVMGEPLPKGDFGEILKDGVILCKLMNKLQAGSVKKFKEKVKINPTKN